MHQMSKESDSLPAICTTLRSLFGFSNAYDTKNVSDSSIYAYELSTVYESLKSIKMHPSNFSLQKEGKVNINYSTNIRPKMVRLGFFQFGL